MVFLLRSSVNADSGLPDIPHVANFRQLSVAQRKSQYEAYQNSLKNRVLTIVRAYNAQKYEQRPLDEIEPGTEFSHVLYCNPYERPGYGQSQTLFLRGGTTADNILRMTGKNKVLDDPAVKKMHKTVTDKQFRLFQSYIHEGWPEELALPEYVIGSYI